jgi:molybdate transport system substrate-binding protein
MKRVLLLWIALVGAGFARAEEITVAAASDLQFALDAVIAAFRAQEAEAAVRVVYGASGNINAQISQGAPYDLYFSADISYPQALQQAGLAASEVRPYALGHLVLWSLREDISQLAWQELTDPRFRRIAIANPQHAPYGRRAREVLQNTGIWQQLQERLVLGDNIAQTAQFVQSGNADAGFVALSLVMAPSLRGKGWYRAVPAELHEPLLQGYIVTRRAQDSALAWRFADFIESEAARQILRDYGFALPSAAAHDAD